jgi:hypothetical protein
MCFFGRTAPVQQLPPPPPVAAAPPQPQRVTVSAPPSLARIDPEQNPQKRAQTMAARRRSSAGAVSGKKRFTIPLSTGGGGSVNY